MGQYRRIKKKTKKKDLMAEPAESAKHWLYDNLELLSLGLGAVILITAIGYGISYYRSSTSLDSNERFYLAVSRVPAQKGTKDQADFAIAQTRKLIDQGGTKSVLTLAHLNIAHLLTRKGEYNEAIREYTSALKKSENGTMLYEIAMVGKANALFRAGKVAEAQNYYKELSRSAKHFPRADAQFSLAFVLVAEGKKDLAIGTLNGLKSSYPSYIPDDYLEDTIVHIEEDVFADIARESSGEKGGGNENAPGDKITPSKVHEEPQQK